MQRSPLWPGATLEAVTRRRDLDRLESEIHELFADLWQLPHLTGLREGFRPHVDCFRTKEPPELTVVADLAGIDPTSIRLVAADRTLSISGERRRPALPSRASFQHMEIDYGPFRRRVEVGADIDTSGAEATYRDGLLTVVFPLRAPRPSGDRVSIKVEARNG